MRSTERERGNETCFNPPPRRGRGGIGATVQFGVIFSGFNPPPRRGRGGMRAGLPQIAASLRVSIRRRVVDAAECHDRKLRPQAAYVFQSAAASWTRRNVFRPPTTHRVHQFQSAAASWTRRNAGAVH